LSHQFRKRSGRKGTDFLVKRGLIQIDRKGVRELLKQTELVRQIDYQSLLKFVNAHRKGRKWDAEANKRDFVRQCELIGSLDDQLDLFRGILGLKPKKYAWSPYPEDGSEEGAE